MPQKSKKPTKTQIARAKILTELAYKHPMIKKLFVLPKKIEFEFCVIEDEGIVLGQALETTIGKKKLYKIKLDPIKLNTVELFLFTFFHELAHIEQFFCGELIYKSPEVLNWHATDYKISDYAEENLPWELAADEKSKETLITLFT